MIGALDPLVFLSVLKHFQGLNSFCTTWKPNSAVGIDNVCKPECRASSLKSEMSCKITMKYVWIVILIYKKIFVTQGVCHLINMVPIEIEFCLFCRGFLRRSALRGRLSWHWKLSTDKKNEIQFVFNGGELSAAAKQAIVFKWRPPPLYHRATFLATPLFLCVDIAIVYFTTFCCFGCTIWRSAKVVGGIMT